MRKSYLIALFAFLAAIFIGCEKENPTSYKNDPAIYFNKVVYQTKNQVDSVSISFLDIPVDQNEFTINVQMLTQGMVDWNNDRKYIVRQKAETPKDPEYEVAQSGTDFAPLEGYYVIPAGKVSGVVPITIFRSENALNNKLELQLEVVANDEFRLGMPKKLVYKVKFSGQPAKPGNWDSTWYIFFGKSWGPVKHMFILEKLGPIDWADIPNLATGTYWGSFMKLELQKYNAANPKNPLQEADKTLVSFNS